MRMLLTAIFILFITYQLVDWLVPLDDSDSPDGKRSGMIIFTDHLTGCQYLKGGLVGSLIARADGQGRQVGCYRNAHD